MNCDGCGACCQFIFFGSIDADAQRWFLLHGFKIIEGQAVLDAPCSQYDEETKKCKIYESRPAICRNTEPGDQICMWCRKYRGITP